MSDSVWPHRRQPTRLPHPWDSPGKNTGVGCHFLLQCMKVKVKSLIRVRLLATPWTAAYQAPPSMGFSRQEYWSGLPFPAPGVLPDPGIEPGSPTLVKAEVKADALTSEPPGKPCNTFHSIKGIWKKKVNEFHESDITSLKPVFTRDSILATVFSWIIV